MKKQKILLYGVGTFKNKGVEAIINSTLNQIDKNKYEIAMASHDYTHNQNYYNDRVYKHIKHYKKNDELTEDEKKIEDQYKSIPFDYNNFELLYQNDVVRELEKSDIAISVGGDNYCYDNCTWLYALDKKSKEMNKKTVLWGASLFEKIDDLELINDLKNFDVLVIRESLSLNAIKDYVDKDKIIYVPDPAFSLKAKEVKLNDWYKKREFVIINLSPLTIKDTDERSTGYKAVIDLIEHILGKTKYSICLLPHVKTDDCNDLDILDKIKEKYKNNDKVYLEEGDYDCCELKYIISKSKIVVTARTHASIAAYSQSIPTLVIGYSVKARGIAKDLFDNIENFVINSDDLESRILIDKFKYINHNRNKIKKHLEKIIPNIIEDSSQIFNKVIEKLKVQGEKTICQREKCIGCGVCKQICPCEAIEMIENDEGYIYPNIKLEKCIHCNKCRNTCPINKKNILKQSEKKYYVAKNKNQKTRKESTSGGVFTLLAEKIIREKGIVYGCEMTDYKATHVRIKTLKDICKIRGSKYIQSNISNTFKELIKDIKSGRKVLYSGTPCQIAAIKAFLGTDYSNLYTVSIICHGVMNSKLLKKHIQSLEKIEDGDISDWKFRSKKNGWTQSSVEYVINQKEYVRHFSDDKLMYLYLKDVLVRESCYRCKYKGENNNADIVLGDYWGAEITHSDFYDEQGVSAIIVNTRKGKKLINEIKKELNYELGDYNEIVVYNPSYISSIKRPKLRTIALNDIDKIEFSTLEDRLQNHILLEEYKKSQTEVNNLRYENRELNNIINAIYESKRWKIIDKIFNSIKKIIGKH